MTVLPEPPEAVGPGAAEPGAAGPVPALDLGPAAVAASLAVAAGTALLGLLAGFAWSLLAPRAGLVIVSPGAAGLVQVETTAFIAADALFCLLTVAGGVVSGALGYLLAVRRHGPLAMAGVLAGALAAAYLTRWVGERSGLATFHHLLATLPAASGQNASALVAPRVSMSRRWAPAGRVASRWWKVAIPDRSPTHRVR